MLQSVPKEHRPLFSAQYPLLPKTLSCPIYTFTTEVLFKNWVNIVFAFFKKRTNLLQRWLCAYCVYLQKTYFKFRCELTSAGSTCVCSSNQGAETTDHSGLSNAAQISNVDS
ncbi:hypothetical protein KIL84_010627 [Mauremys mutica]|uniref:Uncharacterized protein n=1 Tax=Mauremys mutica TaxID=74926 RepID=A0A9D4B1P0_9SAUR|nr:hypothetical protein KIL84_010627 [Mauremys mutica]